MASIFTVLPPELTDQIVGHLRDDFTALGACSLTCRAWVISTQAHIFRAVWVDIMRVESFTELLATSPHIARYVRVLEIQESNGKLSGDPAYLEVAIPQIAPTLVNLQELEVSFLAIWELHTRTLGLAFTQTFPSLRRLALSFLTFENFQEFASVILGHPHIECLELMGLGWIRDIRNHDGGKRPACSLRHLRSLSWRAVRVSGCLINWMLSTQLPTSLRIIKAPAISVEDMPATSRFLAALGPSLEYLEVGIIGARIGPAYYANVSGMALIRKLASSAKAVGIQQGGSRAYGVGEGSTDRMNDMYRP